MSEVNEIQSEFWVPQFNLPGLQQKIDRLGRKAAKLGCKAPVLTVHSDQFEDREVGENDPPLLVRFVKVEVHGEAPKYAGWQIAARLVHENGAVIIRSAPGIELPERFRTIGKVCEHCNTQRHRTDTYVVKHDDGTFKSVGSNCIADFLGHKDPGAIAAQAELVLSYSSLAGEFESGDFGFASGASFFRLDSLLPFVRSYARLFGWVSAKKAQEEGKQSSAGDIQLLLGCFKLSEREKQVLRDVRAGITDEDREWCQKAIVWAASREAATDFDHNLRAIANSGECSRRTFAFACSIVGAYRRHIEGEIVRENNRKASEHFGVVGDKIEATLFVVSVKTVDGFYGPSTIYRLIDAEGRTFIWFTGSGEGKLAEQAWVRVKATIKKHDEFRGLRQTVITRCKRLVTEEEQAAIDGLSQEARELISHLACQYENSDLLKDPVNGLYPRYSDADAEVPPFAELVSKGWVTATHDGGYRVSPSIGQHAWNAAASKPRAKRTRKSA